jgi:phosphinothricin acetyltransferase
MVYVADDARGRGVGRVLMEALVAETEAAGIWTLHAGIFPENAASISVHEAVGFRVVGTYERVGRFRDDRWRDVVLMERRSLVAGTE